MLFFFFVSETDPKIPILTDQVCILAESGGDTALYVNLTLSDGSG